MRRARTFFVCALTAGAILGGAGVASAQSKEQLAQIFADLRMIQEQTQQMRASINQLVEVIKTVNGKVDAQSADVVKRFADQKLLIDALTENARIVREKVDGTDVKVGRQTHEIETLRQEVVALRTLLTETLTQMQAAAAAANAGTINPAAAPPTSPVDPNAPPPPPPTSPGQAWASAWGDYLSADHDMAITGFEYFIRTFPQSPDVEKARFFIGEAYSFKGQHKEAVAAYEQVIARHKGSKWEPEAYYKQGLSFQALGQKDRAKAIFESVVKNFPGSDAADRAALALKRMGGLSDYTENHLT